MKEFFKKNRTLFLIASVTLGLAPFNPPHIVGKLQWILGGNAFTGANAMQPADYFDILLHGTPWVLFLISVVLTLFSSKAKTD